MSEQYSKRRALWKEGTRVFLSTFITCWLLSAITVLPYLATSQDFGHSHPEGTASHSHELDALLAGVPALPYVAIEVSFARYVPLYFSHDDVDLTTPYSASQSRAPPVFV